MTGRQAPRRRRSGGTTEARNAVLGGRRAVTEAIRAGLAEEVLISSEGRPAPGLSDVRAEAGRAGVPVRETPGELLDTLAPNHQRVAVRARIPRPLGERELRTWSFGPEAVVVVLDGLTDPQNVGAAARVAEAAGAAMIVLRERRSGGVTPAAVRASAGALLHLPHARVANLTRVVEVLKDRGFTVVGLDEEAKDSIHDGECPSGPLAVVVGSEGVGMSRLVRESCDQLVRLPMAGRVASLNAASALAAALYGYVLPRDTGALS